MRYLIVSAPAVDQRAPSPNAGVAAPALSTWGRGGWAAEAGCRVLDVVGSAVLLVLLSPLLVAIAIVVRLDSPGPAVFRQERVGRGRKSFTVNKFRSMSDGVAHDRHREFVLGLIRGETPRHDRTGDELGGHDGVSEEIPGLDDPPRPYYKMVADPRVTRFGRVLRRSSLDELPQLWNVLRGDMSLVGPRPAIPYEVDHYPPEWLDRLAVKPGLTGLWQVSGRSQVTLEEMVRLDIDYARRRTVWLNLRILVQTVPAVMFARGAW
jgi:lipopolysaccharide/colanic/teichoic acid biosynthesis glycosyltransferase